MVASLQNVKISCEFGILLCCLRLTSAAILSNEARLVADLLQNYNPHTKPTEKADTTTVVQISFSIGRIEGLNEKDQVLTVFGWIMANWEDELLRWDPKKYNNTNRITLAGNQIWLPEIALINSVVQGNDLAYEAKFRATVYSNGMASWSPGFKWETSCTLNLKYFPYDQHTCSVIFINWMYGIELVNYQIDPSTPGVYTEFIEPNGEWNLINSSISAEPWSMNSSEGFYQMPQVYFNVTLKRNPTFYMWNVVIPSFLMSFMSIMSFMLPCESGEKVGLGVTVLLGYSVILLIVSDITPKSGDSLPLISKYIVYSMVVTSVCLLLTILVLNIHHHNPKKPVPKLVRVIVLKWMAALLCLRTSQTLVHPVQTKRHKTTWQNTNITEIQVNDHKLNTERFLNALNQLLPDHILEFLHKKIDDDREADVIEKNRDDWDRTATVVDRFLLILSFVGICVMSVSFLLVIIYGDTDNV